MNTFLLLWVQTGRRNKYETRFCFHLNQSMILISLTKTCHQVAGSYDISRHLPLALFLKKKKKKPPIALAFRKPVIKRNLSRQCWSVSLSLWCCLLLVRYLCCASLPLLTFFLIDMQPLIPLTSGWKQHCSSDNSYCTKVIDSYLSLFALSLS